MEIKKPYSEVYDKNLELKKYFANLALKYFSLIKLHKDSGHLPTIKNLTGEQIKENIESTGQADWSNVARHCLAEAGAVQALARELKLDPESEYSLVGAAIVHDLNKKIERRLFKESEQNPEAQTKAYYDATEIGNEILTNAGVNPKIIRIAKAVGHHNSNKITSSDTPIEEKILFYIDNITQNTELVNLEEKFQGLIKRYPDLYKAGEYDSWIQSSRKIQSEIASLIGLDKPEELPKWITSKVQEYATKQN